MRSLHIGNIANMAFSYVDILRGYQQNDDVLCYDLDHELSQPHFALTNNVAPSWYKRIKIADCFATLPPVPNTYHDWVIALTRDSKRFGRNAAFTPQEIMSYMPYEQVISKNFLNHNYDLVFAYAYAAIPMMLHSEVPYVPIEIGTLRDITTKTDPFSRLISYAYRTAPHVIITNPDVIGSVKELNINSYTFIPHPIDEELWFKRTEINEKFLQLRKNTDFLIVCPARHDWDVKGNHKYLKAFIQALEAGINAHMVLIQWGNNVCESKNLINAAGISKYITWLDPMRESELADLYSISDLLLDQFGEAKTFGLTTPKAMACSLPVITSFEKEFHSDCYTELPPLIVAHEEDQISQSLIYYSKNRGALETIGRQSRLWVENHHSKAVVHEKFNHVKSLVGEKNKIFPLFSPLKQKKLEIVYEAEYASIYNSKYHDPIPYRLMDKYLGDIVQESVPHKKGEKYRLLDLGCGPGSMVEYLKHIPNLEIYGIDISPAMLKIAREKYPNITFLESDAEDLPFDDGYFDVVLCSGMLHHFPSLDPILLEIKRVLKDGGAFIAREPNERNFSNHVSSISFAHICLRHMLFMRLGKEAIIEPESHDFHRDFDYYNFVEILGEHFKVNELKFGQSISYFYDMLTDSACAPYLQSLEDSLSKFPGLNMITIARKEKECGVSDKVKKQQESYEQCLTNPSAAVINNHIQAVFEFYDWVQQTYPLWEEKSSFYQKIKDMFVDSQSRTKELYFTLQDDVLTASSKKIKPWYRSIFKKVQNEILNFDTPMDRDKFLNENLGTCNHIEITLAGKVNTQGLIKILNTAKDYATISIFPKSNLTIEIDCKSHEGYLSHYYQRNNPFLKSMGESHLFSKFFLTDFNFFEALKAVELKWPLRPELKQKVSLFWYCHGNNKNEKIDFFNKNLLKTVVNMHSKMDR